MPTPKSFCSLLRACALLTFVFVAHGLPAQSSEKSVIEGRIFNPTTGSYLNNARVTVVGTSLEVFTNESGEYRLAGVPVGEVSVQVFYTGLAEQARTVSVAPGATATQDFDLLPVGVPPSTQPANEALQLEKFTVKSKSEIAASAIAINEQRFSPNIKSVVDLGEFGDLGDSNIGEFIKLLPSVSIEYNGSEPRTVAVRGFPASYTALTIDGNRAASAASGQNTRNTELVGFALNNLARIEVTKTPTPDVPADSIGGSVNLVSRSVFERRRPRFSFHTYGTFNSEDVSFDKKNGPSDRTSGSSVRPGFDFVYQNPLTKKFGFSLNGQYFQRLNPTHIARTEWSPTSARIGTGTETNPYLSRFQLAEGPQDSETSSLGATLEYKLTPNDVISLGTSFVARDSYSDLQQMEFLAGDNPVSFGETFTNGGTAGRAGFANSDYRHKTSETSHTSLNYRHIGPVWKADGGLFYSRSTNQYRDISEGYFRGVIIRQRNVTVNYADITETGPGSIVARLGTVPLNPFVLDDLLPEQGSSEESDASDVFRGGHFNLGRDLGFKVPVTVKMGVDFREQHREIDIRSRRWDFRGPDHSGSRPTTGVNSELIKDLLVRYAQPSFAIDHAGDNAPSFGYPVVQWPSSDKFYQFFQATSTIDPLMWLEDTAFANRDSASRSPEITETVGAGYLRGDAKFFDNKLWIVAGVRFESARVDANGVRYVEGTNTTGATSNFTYVRRGDRRITDYDDFFPSLNASYKLARNIVGRVGWSRTVGRPNFVELAPGIIIDDAGAPVYRLFVNNPDLKPAYSNNLDLSLEYYFEDSGVVSIGAFRKDVKDFVGQSIKAATTEDLLAIGIPPTSLDYADFIGDDILKKVNVDSVQIEGVEANYKQPLAFLPYWARGVQIFGNATLMSLKGSNLSDFTGFQRRAVNWGVKLQREKFDFSLNWSYSGRQRGLLITGIGVPANTFEYVEPRLLLDANFGIHVTKRVELYGSARNLTSEPIERLRFSPNTPGYAQPLRYEEYGVQFTLGVRGTF